MIILISLKLLIIKILTNLNNRQQLRYAEKFNPFHVQDGRLFLNELEVVPDAQRNQKLNLLYRDRSVGLGHGQNQWYVIVSSKYLNIPKKVAVEFLKNSVPYQLTRPYVKAKVIEQGMQCGKWI